MDIDLTKCTELSAFGKDVKELYLNGKLIWRKPSEDNGSDIESAEQVNN